MESPNRAAQTSTPARKYDFKTIEAKWQQWWEDTKLFEAPDIPEGEKFYMLVMWPYPSGDIHMGHFRNYIIGDALARRQLMLGKAVMHPLGWDAFGLPAERAAIKRGIHPADWTYGNIKVSRDTLKKVGISYDWSREVASCDPSYYKWTQWIFLQLFKNGLAYRKQGFVNWCPEDKTVLANEQVKEGRCERCGTLIEKKEQEQWYFKITAYADRLIDDLQSLDWPENVKTMQREWIGRSPGLEVDFTFEQSKQTATVFTTRPDTIFGVSFIAISPESQLLSALPLKQEQKLAIEAYRRQALLKTEMERAAAGEKDGVFTGLYVINPYNDERVQVWVADYVLAGYGTGMVMGVPAHDERDFVFAKKYNLPIKKVLQSELGNDSSAQVPFTGYAPMFNSGQFNGLSGDEAIDKTSKFAESKGFGRRKTNFKLKDWSVSRQRYWGCPIPIIHCSRCGMVSVPDDQLPVLLPKVENFLPKGRSPLADVPEYMNVPCPSCGGQAQRDPDTMDTFTDSSWYHLRYLDPKNDDEVVNKSKASAWLPIDLYVGGITHATGHLIYFRFFTKVLTDLGYLNVQEPAQRLFNHGMVMDIHGEVMSKSKGNVVSPIGLMESRGIDVTRLAMFFTAPSELPVLWTNEHITGVEKFLLSRFLPLSKSYQGTAPDLKRYFKKSDLQGYDRDIYVRLNQLIDRINEDCERLQFNTVVSALMELVRDFEPEKLTDKSLSDYILLKAVQLMAPLAPHAAEEMWHAFGFTQSIFRSSWPIADTEALVSDTIEIAIQVNGKLRDTILVSSEAAQAEIERAAFESPKVTPWVTGKEISRKVYVPKRLLNIVIKG